MIKIMLIDDHKMVRSGLKALLEINKGIKVVCEAESGEEAINLISSEVELDLIMLDISLPQMSGIELTKYIKESFPKLAVLILSMHDDEEYIIEALNAGAAGYLTKDASTEEVFKAVNRISTGKMHFASSLTEILARLILRRNKGEAILSSINITDREKDVLKFIIKGLNNKEIAEKLFVSKRTVDNHRFHLMKKMGARNTADIVRIACKNKLITMDSIY